MSQLLSNKYFKLSLVCLIFLLAILFRISMWSQTGGDQLTYKQAVVDFAHGINPYTYTVKSFETPGLKKGYAYFPSLLYIQTFFYALNVKFNLDLPLVKLWKIPVLIFEVITGYVIYLHFKKETGIKFLMGSICLLVWFFNPYIAVKQQFTYYDSLAVLPLLIAFYYLGKKDGIAGFMYALAISLKTFPIILAPIIFFNAKNRKLLLISAISWGLLVSLPFMKSLNDFSDYIKGALLVQGERGVQGRPFITILEYLTHTPPIQALYVSLFAYASILISWAVSLFLLFQKKIKDSYILAGVAFATYFLITPVFNRTHIIWGIPFLLLGLYSAFQNSTVKFFCTVAAGYAFLAIYLYFWQKGIVFSPTLGSSAHLHF